MSPELRAEMEKHLAGWGVVLSPDAWPRLDNYLKDVMEYGKKVNITAAKSSQEIVRRHFVDALAALAPLQRRLGPAPRLLDAGAGAGFIGLCLKIAWPQASVTLLESAYRKYCFLNWASARIALAGLRVVHGRTENAEGGYDAVLSRALAPLPKALNLTFPLVRPGGFAVVYQSAPPEPSEKEEIVPYRLPGEKQDRYLLLARP